MDDAESLIVC